MNPFALQLIESAAVDVSVPAVVFAYGLFGILLVLIMRAVGCERRETLMLLGIFTWFLVPTGVFYWWLELQPNPPDAIFYWRWSASIVESGFDRRVIAAAMQPSLAGLSVNSFILLGSLVGALVTPRFEILTIFNIFVATLAVLVASRIARTLFGPRAQVATLILFTLYFAMYWSSMHNLREAVVLLFLGAWIWAVLRWRRTGHGAAIAIALIAAVLFVVFRFANVIFVMSFVALYALVTARTALQLVPRLVVIAVAVGATIYLAFEITGSNPLLAINVARELRIEGGGGYRLMLPDLQSFADLVWQVPASLTFFLVPVMPWEIDVGLRFTLNYVHSLSALVLLLFGSVGAVSAMRRHPERKTIAAFVLASAVMAMAYGLPENSAESASRHALFFYYVLLLFAAHGVERTRVALARMAAGYEARRARPPRVGIAAP